MSALPQRARAWWQRILSGPRAGVAGRPGLERWVVLDVETSGLDTSQDKLLAIAAVALRVDWARARLDITLGDSFEVLLRQDLVSSRDDILLRGIGEQRQRAGLAPALALQAFADFVQSSPLLAFRSGFDESLIGRHCQQHLGRRLANPWLDMEHLCVLTQGSAPARSLDDWFQHFGIECAQRHQAAADALAESELLQRIGPALFRQCRCWDDVIRLAGHRRWLRD